MIRRTLKCTQETEHPNQLKHSIIVTKSDHDCQRFYDICNMFVINHKLLCPAPRVGALSDDAHLTSDACLSVAYIGPKSRTEMPRKTKISRGSPRHTNSDTTFKVKR